MPRAMKSQLTEKQWNQVVTEVTRLAQAREDEETMARQTFVLFREGEQFRRRLELQILKFDFPHRDSPWALVAQPRRKHIN